jgi:hypothetical protein
VKGCQSIQKASVRSLMNSTKQRRGKKLLEAITREIPKKDLIMS